MPRERRDPDRAHAREVVARARSHWSGWTTLRDRGGDFALLLLARGRAPRETLVSSVSSRVPACCRAASADALARSRACACPMCLRMRWVLWAAATSSLTAWEENMHLSTTCSAHLLPWNWLLHLKYVHPGAAQYTLPASSGTPPFLRYFLTADGGRPPLSDLVGGPPCPRACADPKPSESLLSLEGPIDPSSLTIKRKLMNYPTVEPPQTIPRPPNRRPPTPRQST